MRDAFAGESGAKAAALQTLRASLDVAELKRVTLMAEWSKQFSSNAPS